MRIKYVVSTMIFWGRETCLSFEQECQFLRSMGFGVELWPNVSGLDDCRYEKHNWSRLLAATDGMLVSMRARNDDPTLEEWAEQIECAQLLNANIVTDTRSLGLPERSDLNGCDFAADVVKMADEKNVKLCLETGYLKTLKQVGKRFDSIKYCLDVGYANLDTDFTFKEYVDELVEKVAHIHLTDNYGQMDDHEPPGLQGGINRENWDYLLNALNKHDNDVIGSLEMHPCMPAVMMRKASEFLFKELNWPTPPKKHPEYSEAGYNPN